MVVANTATLLGGCGWSFLQLRVAALLSAAPTLHSCHLRLPLFGDRGIFPTGVSLIISTLCLVTVGCTLWVCYS